ncbi:FAD/NAD(P)-binding protein [Streptomyces sp. 8N706]|uniref:FAD/NAD(P)-binding protein n=1 Tax=Streptomyces sp. 8N706 TaxID=3457416 RepID=UPI003FD61977
MAGEHHAIAVVGAGPRGTSVLERVCASVPELLPGEQLTVHMIDPAPPGTGRVWRTEQPGELLMNTVASQVTLFTDDSVECDGPIVPGPSLYEWASTLGAAECRDPLLLAEARRLGPDDYPSRAFYGHYLTWVFRRIVGGAPRSVNVEVHTARAVRLEERAGGEQLLTLEDGRELPGLAAVVLAQGHLPVVLGEPEERFASYAAEHGLRYYPPANPADLDLSLIAPGEPVLLRGLGLNFFDHVALLTAGRGGVFTTAEDGSLRYRPSGLEPRLYAGSRRGIPYHARGDNAKGPCGRHEPLLLTSAAIADFRARADRGDYPDFLAEVWPLVAKEVETVYYEALVSGPAGAAVATRRPRFRERFLGTPHGSAEEAAVLDEFGIPAEARWSWRDIARPHGGRGFAGPGDFRRWLVAHLRRDAEHARLGNVDGPVKAALDVLRDLRNELRQIVDHAGLSGPSRRDHLDRWYTPLNAFLSIGPPRRRIEEMAALIEAGVLEVLGPRLEVRLGVSGGQRFGGEQAGRQQTGGGQLGGEQTGAQRFGVERTGGDQAAREQSDGERPDGERRNGERTGSKHGFTAHSPEVPGSAVTVTTVIEARLPEPDLRRTSDPLLARLLKTGACRPHVADGYETGGLDVTRRPYRLVDREGRPHPRRFAVGVPTEGVHWVTAAGARPGVNSVTLSDADAVARAVLRITASRKSTFRATGQGPDRGRILNLQVSIRHT